MTITLSSFCKKLNSKISKWKYRRLKNKTVVIYTLGKVGSSTLYYELKKLSPWNNVFHAHFLSDEWLLKRLKNTNHFEFNNQSAQKVFSYLNNNPNKQKKIITLVREPISRELSNFMQNPKDYAGSDLLIDGIEKLQQVYLDKVSYEYTLNWFDSEFYNYTGFDVFSKTFDKEKGYAIYSHKDTDILIIKLEKLNECYTSALNDFLGINLQLQTNANQSSNKPISKVYTQLKNSIKFSKEELQDVYNHKYVTHFYTEKEIIGFIKKHEKH